MPDLVKDIVDLGVAGGVILLLIGGFREWWVYGPQHRRIVADLTADRDFWRTTALRSLGVAKAAVTKPAPDEAPDA